MAVNEGSAKKKHNAPPCHSTATRRGMLPSMLDRLAGAVKPGEFDLSQNEKIARRAALKAKVEYYGGEVSSSSR